MNKIMDNLFGDDYTTDIPMMPEEYKGKMKKGTGYTKTQPRRFTAEEIAWIKKMKSEGYSNEEIAVSTGRTSDSIGIKLKRIGKKNGTYNDNHVAEKYALNQRFAKIIDATSLLDLYCGAKSWWRNSGLVTSVTTNDIEKTYDADYHEKAEKLIHKLYYIGCRYDVIDLDPYGSAYECFDLAVKMADKGLVVTFGEIGHKRWKRLDFVRRHYGITSLDDLNLQALVDHLEMIANRNKKHLTVIFSRQWDFVARVWFKVERLKITEQWDKYPEDI